MIGELRDVAPDHELEADVCVVGAGAVGLTLARRLAGTRLEVIVLESGGLEVDARTQALHQLESVGERITGLDGTRLRYFGGTTNHWGGYCAPLAELDFEPRSWLPESGWPIRRKDLEPWYERACETCEIPYRFTPETYDGLAVPAFDRRKLEPVLYRMSPTRFGARYRDDVRSARNVRALLRANVTQIELARSGARVERVRVQTLDGARRYVRARCFVIACGAIENARILLASNEVEPAGIGNRHDRVGRFFMEHPQPRPDPVLLGPDLTRAGTPFRWLHHRGRARLRLALGADAQRRERITSALLKVVTTFHTSSGYPQWRWIREALERGEWPSSLARRVYRVLRDLPDLYEGVARPDEHGEHPGRVATISVNVSVEQSPNPASRVTLIQERDPLGMPRAKLDWRLSELDRRTAFVAYRLLGEEVGRLGLARLRMDPRLEPGAEPGWERIDTGSHHAGTTRMSDDPKRGVVDADCRVHGVANLYVAGGSVFPTCGSANPTLTLVALAERLAEHLRTRLASG